MPFYQRGSSHGGAIVVLLLFASACMKNSEPPPLGADENAYLPSGKVYKRTPQVIVGKKADPQFDWVDVTYRNVAEAAQVYADFSGLEVRVPRSIDTRQMRFGGPPQGSLPGNVTYGYVITNLDWQLPYEGVEIVKLGRGVVAFRALDTKAEPERPRQATTEEIARYANSLSEEKFWQMIDRAKQAGAGECLRTAEALKRSLSRLSTDELLGFHVHFERKMAESYRHDLWAVAYIANGGASDDGFTYFRAWLIGQGRERYEAALQHPPAAVEGLSKPSAFMGFECEELLYPSMEVHQQKTGHYPPIGVVAYPVMPAGTPWKEEDLPKLYPDLYRRFR